MLHTLRTPALPCGFEAGVFAASACLRVSDRLGGMPQRGGLRDGPQRPPIARRYPETVGAGSAVDEAATRPQGSAPGKAQRHRRRLSRPHDGGCALSRPHDWRAAGGARGRSMCVDVARVVARVPSMWEPVRQTRRRLCAARFVAVHARARQAQ